ncbi:MAG: ParB N-terminal domain-containing protein, partial [Clostridia bacterium]|nr:ParB N-terminal domain-containing protein [Clostridia bacterium]
CSPKVGPNYQIISEYMYSFRLERQSSKQYCEEPLIVEKIRPDGYMILNGHHRWAAALQLGFRRIPIEVVDLTQEMDIRNILQYSEHDKRVTLDLDEVVFRPEGDDPAEKPLPFPLRNIYKQRLRLGIPALFHYLNKKGYDIWVYSAGYYSADYIQRLFRKYGVHVTGAVTGTGRKTGEGREIRRELVALITAKYPETVHIDDAAVLRIFSQTKQVEEYNLGEGAEAWSKRVIDVMETFERHG